MLHFLADNASRKAIQTQIMTSLIHVWVTRVHYKGAATVDMWKT